MKVLIPKIRSNGTIRISVEDTNVAVLKGPGASNYFRSYNFCIAKEKVGRLPKGTKIEDFNPGLISEPSIMFRGDITSMQNASKVYSLGGVDFILHDKHYSIWESNKAACPDIKEQLIELFNIEDTSFKEPSGNDIMLLSLLQEIISEKSGVVLLNGYNDLDTEALQFMVEHPERFIDKAGEEEFRRVNIGKKVIDKEVYDGLMLNPIVYNLLKRNRSDFIKFLLAAYTVDIGNPYVLKLLYNKEISYLSGNFSLANEYNVSRYDDFYNIMNNYSADAYRIYNTFHYHPEQKEATDVFFKDKYGMSAVEFNHDFGLNDNHLKIIIKLKTSFKDILRNFKVDYDIV